jgi:hypothetical protein
LETSLKALAHGPLSFCKDPFNAFDAIIFIITLVDFGTDGHALHNVASMRTFRVLRVFQLAGKWPSFAIFLSSVFSAMRAVRPFALLLLLFILVSALLGMQILAGKLDFPEGRPRSHYDNFYWACLTTFQVRSVLSHLFSPCRNFIFGSSSCALLRHLVQLPKYSKTLLNTVRAVVVICFEWCHWFFRS